MRQSTASVTAYRHERRAIHPTTCGGTSRVVWSVDVARLGRTCVSAAADRRRTSMRSLCWWELLLPSVHFATFMRERNISSQLGQAHTRRLRCWHTQPYEGAHAFSSRGMRVVWHEQPTHVNVPRRVIRMFDSRDLIWLDDHHSLLETSRGTRPPAPTAPSPMGRVAFLWGASWGPAWYRQPG